MVRKKRTQNENKKSAAFFSGLFFIAGLSVLVMIGISLGKEAYRKRQIQKEIENLQNEIQKTNRENSDLQNLISYFSTSEFQEKEAREKLNLQKENEKMIVLRREANQPKETTGAGQVPASDYSADKSPNWQKWLQFFFEKR